MRYVNIETDLPANRVALNLKKADYFHEKDKFTLWSLADYNKNQKGIHLSYDDTTKKICAYNEDGDPHKDFLAPINEIFVGKIVEKNNKVSIKGIVCMSPIFNIVAILAIIGVFGFYFAVPNPNIMILLVVFIAYFMFAKSRYKNNMQSVVYFLGQSTYKKPKKNNPNKKAGKYARKQ